MILNKLLLFSTQRREVSRERLTESFCFLVFVLCNGLNLQAQRYAHTFREFIHGVQKRRFILEAFQGTV